MPPRDPSSREKNRKDLPFPARSSFLCGFLSAARASKGTPHQSISSCSTADFWWTTEILLLINKQGFSGIWVQAFFVCVSSLLDHVQVLLSPRFRVLWMDFL
jgi:hypothetical protein